MHATNLESAAANRFPFTALPSVKMLSESCRDFGSYLQLTLAYISPQKTYSHALQLFSYKPTNLKFADNVTQQDLALTSIKSSLRRNKPTYKIDASTCNGQLRPPTNALSLQINTSNSAQILMIARLPIHLIDLDRLESIHHQHQATSDRFLKFSVFSVSSWLCVRFDPNPPNPIDHRAESLETNAKSLTPLPL